MPLHCMTRWPLSPFHLNLPLILMSAGLLLIGMLTISSAQVSTTITPDGTLGTTVTQDGNRFDIMQGTRPGNGPNLFHSFDRFSVGTHDTAGFIGDSRVENIISRVTGGMESMIDGGLESTATLFLLNPSGVMFGPNATLNINGSFHVSTADVLRLGDGGVFHAALAPASILTVAPPSAFGFISAQPTGIAIERSRLHVPTSETVAVIGGDLTIAGGGS